MDIINNFEDLLEQFFHRQVSEIDWDIVLIGIIGMNERCRISLIEKIKDYFLLKDNTNFFCVSNLQNFFENKELLRPLIHLCLLKYPNSTIMNNKSLTITLNYGRHILHKIKQNGLIYIIFNSYHIKALDIRIRENLSFLIRTDLNYEEFKFISVKTLSGDYFLFRKDNLLRVPDEVIKKFLKHLIEKSLYLKNKTTRLIEFDLDKPFELEKIINFLEEREIQYFIDSLRLKKFYKKIIK